MCACLCVCLCKGVLYFTVISNSDSFYVAVVDLLAESGVTSNANGVYTFFTSRTASTLGKEWISLLSSTELSFNLDVDSDYVGSVIQIVDDDSNNQLSLSIDEDTTQQSTEETNEHPKKLVLMIGEHPTVFEFKYTATSGSFQALSLALSDGGTRLFFVDQDRVTSVTVPGNLAMGMAKGVVLFDSSSPKNVAHVSRNEVVWSNCSLC